MKHLLVIGMVALVPTLAAAQENPYEDIRIYTADFEDDVLDARDTEEAACITKGYEAVYCVSIWDRAVYAAAYLRNRGYKLWLGWENEVSQGNLNIRKELLREAFARVEVRMEVVNGFPIPQLLETAILDAVYDNMDFGRTRRLTIAIGAWFNCDGGEVESGFNPPRFVPGQTGGGAYNDCAQYVADLALAASNLETSPTCTDTVFLYNNLVSLNAHPELSGFTIPEELEDAYDLCT